MSYSYIYYPYDTGTGYQVYQVGRYGLPGYQVLARERWRDGSLRPNRVHFVYLCTRVPRTVPGYPYSLSCLNDTAK